MGEGDARRTLILWGREKVVGRVGTEKAGKSLQDEEMRSRSPKSALGL